MNVWTGELEGMINVLKNVGLADGMPAFTSDVFDYVVKYSGHTMVWEDEEDDMMDITEEEMRIMNVHDRGYRQWYHDQLDDIILGDEE
ncbi:hypothetical protein KAR91_52360 [Candidatus Pacearchaeota archaeon]|nr:hypothetical protein [Candidatus Pacearchaeota archaeon]